MRFHLSQKNSRRQGFTLLFAILVASLLLSVGLAILDLTVKRLTLSAFGRESLMAFYAADSGAECARYWDLKRDAFSTTTVFSGTMTCNGQVVKDSNGQPAVLGGDTLSVFQFDLSIPGGQTLPAYVEVTLEKDPVTGRSTVSSRGYNTGVATPRRVERGIRTE